MTFHGRNKFGNKWHESLGANLIFGVPNDDKRLFNLSTIFVARLTCLWLLFDFVFAVERFNGVLPAIITSSYKTIKNFIFI